MSKQTKKNINKAPPFSKSTIKCCRRGKLAKRGRNTPELNNNKSVQKNKLTQTNSTNKYPEVSYFNYKREDNRTKIGR